MHRWISQGIDNGYLFLYLYGMGQPGVPFSQEEIRLYFAQSGKSFLSDHLITKQAENKTKQHKNIFNINFL